MDEHRHTVDVRRHCVPARPPRPHHECARAGRWRRDLPSRPWQRPEGGGGESRVLRDGAVFEQAGINFSHVTGSKLPASATAAAARACGCKLRGDGRVAGDPSAQSLRADLARQRAFLHGAEGRAARGLVVRRRLRPHARTTRSTKTCCTGTARRKRPATHSAPTCYAKYKDWCDRYFYLQAPQRDARRRAGSSSTT